MGTIAKYVIEATVDPTGVKRGIGDVISTMQKMQRVAKERIKLELQFPDLEKARKAQELLGGLQKEFNQMIAQDSEKLFRGQIDSKQFKQGGIDAAKFFNQGLIDTLDTLKSQKLLTPAIHEALVSQFKRAGLDAGTELGKAASRGAAAHPLLGNLTTQGQRAANSLLNGLNATFKARTNELKEQLVQGTINVQTYRRRGVEAAQEFDKGLNKGLQELRAKGQATEKITEALVSSFKLAGLKAANSFALSLDKQLGENVTRIGQTLSRAVTLPIAAGATAALKLGADFENSMLRVQAIVKPTTGQLEKLTDQARHLGAISQFSGKDAAQAMALLGQSTLNTTQILKAMPVVTDLAASSFIDMTTAADDLTSILFGFGLQVDDIRPKVDEIVALTLMFKTNIQDLTQAFSFVGPDARAAGQSFETIAIALGAMIKAGVPASRAGTALRGILAAIKSPTKEAGKALEDLGIKVIDPTTHRLKDLITIVGEFEKAAKKFTPDSFQNLLGNIFEQRAGTGFNVLLLQGVDNLEKLRKKMGEVGGTTEHLAEVQMSGLTGAWRELVSAVQELALAVANSGLLKAFTDIIRGAAGLILMLSRVNPNVLKFVSYMALATATLGPFLSALGKTLTLLSIARSAALLAGTSFLGIGTALAIGGGVLVGLAALAALLLKAAENAEKARQRLEEFQSKLVTKSGKQLEALQRDIITSITFNQNLLREMEAADRKRTANNPFTFQGFSEGTKKISNLIEEQQAMLRAVQQTMKDMAEAGDPLEGISATVNQMLEGVLGNTNGIVAGLQDAKTPAEDLADRVKLLSDLAEGAQGNFRAIPGLIDAIGKAQQDLNALFAASPKAVNETTAALLNIQKNLQNITKDATFLVPVDAAERLRHAIDDMGPFILEVVPMMASTTGFKSDLERQFAEFQRIASNAAAAKIDVSIADQSGDFILKAIAADKYAKALARAQQFEKTFATAIALSNIPASEKADLWAKITDMIKSYEDEADKSVKKTKDLSDTFNSIANGVRGITAIANAFGKLSDGAAQALDAVADLADSIGSLVKSIATGDIAGAISSGIGVIGSVVKLLGAGSKADEDAKRIARENTAALDALKRSVDGWAVTVKTIGQAQPVIKATIESISAVVAQFSKSFSKIDLGKVQFKSVEELDRQLRAAGSSFKDMVAIADELNVQLFNDKGRLTAAGLDALNKAIELERIKLTQFGDTLDAQKQRLELRRNVLNLDTSPLTQLQDSLDLLGQFAPGLAKMLQGFDIQTERGRAALEAAVQNLFKMVENKMIDPALFGDIDITQFQDIIKAMADSFDTLREQTDKTSESMSGLPAGFKIERARWKALLTAAEQSVAVMGSQVTGAGNIVSVASDSSQKIRQVTKALFDQTKTADTITSLQKDLTALLGELPDKTGTALASANQPIVSELQKIAQQFTTGALTTDTTAEMVSLVADQKTLAGQSVATLQALQANLSTLPTATGSAVAAANGPLLDQLQRLVNAIASGGIVTDPTKALQSIADQTATQARIATTANALQTDVIGTLSTIATETGSAVATANTAIVTALQSLSDKFPDLVATQEQLVTNIASAQQELLLSVAEKTGLAVSDANQPVIAELQRIVDLFPTLTRAQDTIASQTATATEGFLASLSTLATQTGAAVALANQPIIDQLQRIADALPTLTVGIQDTPGTTSIGTGAVVPTGVTPTNVTLQFGDIIITNPVKDGKQVYEEVKGEAKARLAAKYGVGAVKNLSVVMP